MRAFLLIGTAAAVGAAGFGAERLRRPAHGEAGEQAVLAAAIEPRTMDTALLAASVFAETNRVRRTMGLRPFRANRRLDQAAGRQAEMGSLLMMTGHDNPRRGEGSPFERVVNAGLAPGMVAENIALTPLGDAEVRLGAAPAAEDSPLVTYADCARRVVEQWMDSPAHRSNILNPHLDYLGCSVRPKKAVNGMDLLYSVQVFYTPVRREG